MNILIEEVTEDLEVLSYGGDWLHLDPDGFLCLGTVSHILECPDLLGSFRRARGSMGLSLYLDVIRDRQQLLAHLVLRHVAMELGPSTSKRLDRLLLEMEERRYGL